MIPQHVQALRPQQVQPLQPEMKIFLFSLPLLMFPGLFLLLRAVLGGAWRTLAEYFDDKDGAGRTGWQYARPLAIGMTNYGWRSVEYMNLEQHLCLRVGGLLRVMSNAGSGYLAIPHAAIEVGPLSNFPLVGEKLRTARIHCTKHMGPIVQCRLPQAMFVNAATYRR